MRPSGCAVSAAKGKDLTRSRLGQILSWQHPLLVLADKIDRSVF
jgi:hypothetical protein